MDTEKKEKLKGIILVNLATLTWATNIALGRHLRNDIGPLSLAAARYCVAALVFALLLRKAPPEERRRGGDGPALTGMTISGILLFAPLLYFGLNFTTAVNGTLINGIAPLLTAFFAAGFIKEPFSRRQAAGSVIALAGVLTLISGASPAFFRTAAVNPGDLLVVSAVLMWSLYSVAARRAMRSRSPLSATALSIFPALPVLLAAALWESIRFPPVVSPKLAALVLYIGLVPAALGFLAWNWGIKKLGAGGAMVFYNTLPLYGALLGIFFLGETPGAAHLAGGLMIIAGGLVAARS